MTDLVRYGTASLVAFFALTAVTILAVTMLIWLAAAGRSVLVVFPFSACAWGGYLLSHYVVEGTFVDEGIAASEDQAVDPANGRADSLRGSLAEVRASPTRTALAVVGVGSMLLTFPTGIVAVGSGNLGLMIVSSTLFVGGYVVGHQGVTGKPL